MLGKHVRLQSGVRQIGSSASAGFTLIEMLVVLTIIGLIVGLVGPRVLGYLADLRVKTARLQIESLGVALDLFYVDVGRYPTTAESLDALVRRPPGVDVFGNGPYVKGARVPLDPWGHPYQYHSPVEKAPYEIVSFGSDGRGRWHGDSGRYLEHRNRHRDDSRRSSADH